MQEILEGKGVGLAHLELTLSPQEKFVSQWLCQLDPASPGLAFLWHLSLAVSVWQHDAPAPTHKTTVSCKKYSTKTKVGLLPVFVQVSEVRGWEMSAHAVAGLS